jgi:hypothetical protein
MIRKKDLLSKGKAGLAPQSISTNVSFSLHPLDHLQANHVEIFVDASP